MEDTKNNKITQKSKVPESNYKHLIDTKQSEEMYRSLFDSFPHFIGLIDMNGALIDCNPAVNHFLSQHKREDIIGVNFIKTLSIIDKNKILIPKIEKLIKETNKDGKLKAFEFKLHRSIGEYLWLHVEGSAIKINDQKYIQFIIQDITARKNIEEKLLKSESKLQLRIKELSCIYQLSKLIENKSISIEGLLHGSLEILPAAFQFSDIFCARISYSGKEYTSINYKISKWMLSTREVINEKEMVIDVIYLEDKPFQEEEYDMLREIGIRLKSCIEEREAQAKVNESEKKYHDAYKRANFYKDLFAHDINNILQIITSSAELISIQLGDSEKSKILGNLTKIINQQVERGGTLVRNVHTLSKLEEEDVIVQPIKINETLRKSIEFVKKSYEDRQLQIQVDSTDVDFIVQANIFLQDVFENILINGVKYNENPNVDILIRISNVQMDNTKLIRMEFIDNGIGVPDDRKGIIFKRGNRKLKGDKGMGLGLSLVSKIINSFNGKIWVEDKIKGDYRKGSNFIIILPIKS